MVLRSLKMLSFRAHAESYLEPGPKVNLIWGPNGAGKTNILEAVHYCCLGKSFLTTGDTYALRRGDPFFELVGTFEAVDRADFEIRVAFVPDQGKRILINKAPLERLSEILGVAPVVTFSPEDYALTAGPPDERRRFLDNVLSQARPLYLRDLLSYKRALRQRTELLIRNKRGTLGAPLAPLLEPWTAELVRLGTRIVAARATFIRTFGQYLQRAYSHIADTAEEPSIRYKCSFALPEDPEESAIAERFTTTIGDLERRERDAARTLIGPHLDDLGFRLNGLNVRRYASQGQHRTYAMSVRLAQYFFLQERRENDPILLLDDVFGILDPGRVASFLRLLQSDAVGQSLVTTAQPELFGNIIRADNHSRLIEVRAGGVVAPTV